MDECALFFIALRKEGRRKEEKIGILRNDFVLSILFCVFIIRQ
jgi:hypothetical protein